MNIYCVDDNVLQLKRSTMLAATVCKQLKIEEFSIETFSNGDELLNGVDVREPDLVLLDIHMPVLDGLSTLVKLRKKNCASKIVMVSSENSNNVQRFKNKEREEVDDAKKKELLTRVVERVKNNYEQPGKINSVLEACGNLGLNPVEVSIEYGADGYIMKPYDSHDASNVLTDLLTK